MKHKIFVGNKLSWLVYVNLNIVFLLCFGFFLSALGTLLINLCVNGEEEGVLQVGDAGPAVEHMGWAGTLRRP